MIKNMQKMQNVRISKLQDCAEPDRGGRGDVETPYFEQDEIAHLDTEAADMSNIYL